MGDDRPGNAGVFSGERDSRHIHMPALLQSLRPSGLRVGLFVDHTQICSRAVHPQAARLPVAPAGDLAEPVFAAA